MKPPARVLSEPNADGHTCRPKIAEGRGFCRAPSAIIASAPPSPSSAGWKMNFTVPGMRSFMPANTSAVPIMMAT